MALETKRLTVRTLHEEDYQDFLEYAMDPELCRMLGWSELSNEEAVRKLHNENARGRRREICDSSA